MRLLHDSRRRLLDILNTKRNRKSEVPGMHIMLCLGGVKICLDCEKEIQIEDVFLPFIIRERSGISGQDEKWKETDILAAVSWKWVKPPLRSAVKLGEDLIQTYYRREEKNYCIVWEGEKGAISCVEYDDTFSHVSCRIQERLLPVAPKSLGEILRYFPMRAILQQFLVLFFTRHRLHIRKPGFYLPDHPGRERPRRQNSGRGSETPGSSAMTGHFCENRTETGTATAIRWMDHSRCEAGKCMWRDASFW